jgi:hypothetical protein
MRLLFLALAGFSVVLQVQPSAPERPSEDHRHTGGDKQATADTSNNPSKNVIAVPNPESVSHSDKQKEDADKMEDRRERKAQARLNCIYTWTTVAGVVGGWIGLFVLIWQTKLTGISANAAKTSADALIRGQRAWLLIDNVEQPVLVPAPAPGDLQQPKLLCSCFSFKNMGKTPARLVAWKSELQIGGSSDKPDTETGFDIGSQVFCSSMIPQGEVMPEPEEARLSSPITALELKDIIVQKTRFLWLCGVLKYEDVFRRGVVHETRFCYLYETRLNTNIPLWRIAGPKEYNEAT